MEETTKAEATKKAAKLVKVRALRPFAENGVVVIPGQTVEVSPERADELTKSIVGPFDFRGERYDGERDHRRHDLKKAEVVA